MILTIVILAYVANVFLTRWMNKKLYQLDNDFTPLIMIWFLPIVGFIAYFIIYLIEYFEKHPTKFTGKNW
jgi:hypothetical protein